MLVGVVQGQTNEKQYIGRLAQHRLAIAAQTDVIRSVAIREFFVQQGESVYNIYDMEFGQKVWPIMFSGWGVLDED